MSGITGLLTSTSTTVKNGIRPFDPHRDMSAVADLIELGFADTLDEDGQRYLRQMRAAANGSGWLGFTSIAAYWASGPMSGYVWEEDGRMVGNMSLIPYLLRGRRNFLIANVVVHPEYRRRGIARALTVQGIEHVSRAGAPSVWLHVREENEAAVALYRSLGFAERARRTTWQSVGGIQTNESIHPEMPSGLQIGSRRGSHWELQREWLGFTYPTELTWHLPLKINALRPDVLGAFLRLVNDVYTYQWSAEHKNDLQATATWQSTHGYSDIVWLAAPVEAELEAVQVLLAHVISWASSRRPLTLDYPAHQFEEAIQQSGFKMKQTLIWMEIGF